MSNHGKEGTSRERPVYLWQEANLNTPVTEKSRQGMKNNEAEIATKMRSIVRQK
ncbi:hypothetical protein SCLCIDRAFT_1207032 [Scleroderma citrinum Foug A]|uniref:Uncharacterized protein n=1 Tax=Scleroderma citrinum Foug A TaxID=1036808 RepID=A0A0C3ESN6_9AGAM|nr:hypothetical protein SCLCIDRAFT_1207032 [Scleroderma citrinum Foug A]